MPFVRAAVAAAVLSTAVLLPTGPAGAQTERVVDPVDADVWVYGPDDADPEGDWVYSKVGSMINADVVKTTVVHTAERIILRVKYADLDKSASVAVAYRGFLKLNSGKVVGLGFWATPNQDWKEHSYLDVVNLPAKASGGGIEACKGHTAKLNFDKDLFTASVLRECLRNPDWVKLFGWARSVEVDDQGNDVWEFYDNAGSDGYELADTWSHRVTSG